MSKLLTVLILTRYWNSLTAELTTPINGSKCENGSRVVNELEKYTTEHTKITDDRKKKREEKSGEIE